MATFQLGCSIDLVPVAIAMGGRAEHHVFPAMVSHSTDTATSNSVFATGRTVEVGCKSEDHALLAAHMLAFKIYMLTGQICGVHNFEICNVVRVCAHREKGERGGSKADAVFLLSGHRFAA